MSGYCWMFGEHNGDPCSCGWSSETDLQTRYNYVEGLNMALAKQNGALQEQMRKKDELLEHVKNILIGRGFADPLVQEIQAHFLNIGGVNENKIPR